METRRRKLLEKSFGRWSAGKTRSVLMAAALLGLAVATQPAHAQTPGYGGCGGYGGSGGTIRQLDKSTGVFVREITRCQFKPGGMSDDPASFASEFKEVLWTKDPIANQLEAIEIPGGTLGQRLGPPVQSPGSCPGFGGNVSTDGDGLLNCWKRGDLWSDGKPGINYAGNYAMGSPIANRDVVLCVPADTTNIADDCALPGRKDAFLEIDYMQFHRPTDAAVTAVKNVFLSAPNPPGGPGPITLHVLIDEQITYKGSSHQNNLAFVPCTGPAGAADGDYDGIKALHFGTTTERASANALNAKALAFRYALFVHNLLGLGSTSGCAEIGGNDLVVAMGSFTSLNGHNIGSPDEVQSTLLHEFGHTVGLRHGGGDNVNCKPNQVSVMNYTNQFSKPLNKVGQRPLDYSRGQFGGTVVLLDLSAAVALDKSALQEPGGIGPLYVGPIAYGPVPTFGTAAVVQAGGGVDWNKDADSLDTFLSLDVDQTTNAAGGCPPNQLGPPNNPNGQYLVSFNEWSLVNLNFRNSVDFGEGHVTAGETTLVLDPTTGLPVPAGTPGITLDEVFAFNVGVTSDKIAIVPHRIVITADQYIGVVIFGRPDAPGQPGTGLNAATIDPASLKLASLDGGTWVLSPLRSSSGRYDCVIFDVNRDGVRDFSCAFKVPKGTIGQNESRAVLRGTTLPPNGHPVLSWDFIKPKLNDRDDPNDRD